MKDLVKRLLQNLNPREEQTLRAETMRVDLALYILVAVLMSVAILLCLCLIVLVLRCCCRRRKKRTQNFYTSTDWIRSASIEHMRFDPEEVVGGTYRGLRTSTPHNFDDTISLEDFIRSQRNNNNNSNNNNNQSNNQNNNQNNNNNNNIGTTFHSGYFNPLEMVKIPTETQEINPYSRPYFQTFGGVGEPKYIYWETRV